MNQLNQLSQQPEPTHVLIQSDIPMPQHANRAKSELRHQADTLLVGQCLTLVATSVDEQRVLAKRLNALRTALISEMPENNYAVRSMWGEVDGDVKPVARLWRTK